jgi:CRAL/TRIO domain
MTDFGLANMDYPPLKFMIKCFEANYPESLGTILIHKAPWIFQGIWRVVRGWLDPVVAGKVHFTNSGADLEQFVEPSLILKELGGENPYTYEYIEPVSGENDIMKDEDAKRTLLEERKQLALKYEDIVKEWANTDSNTDGAWAELRKKRDEIAGGLKANYWRLDPYIRARSMYDRNGEMKSQNPEADREANIKAATKVDAKADTKEDAEEDAKDDAKTDTVADTAAPKTEE